jgi:hypothetical protein
MQKIKVVFIRSARVLGLSSPIPELIEQNFLTDKENFEIPIPQGYQIGSITKYLPDQTILKAEA